MSRSTKRRRRDAPTPRKLNAFLRRLASTGSVSEAARAIGASRNTLYRLRRSDKAFAARWEMARDGAFDAAFTEASRRAIAGTEQPVIHRGRRIGAIRTYNDKLLMSLLRLHWRHVHGHNSGQISGQSESDRPLSSSMPSSASPTGPRRPPTAT